MCETFFWEQMNGNASSNRKNRKREESCASVLLFYFFIFCDFIHMCVQKAVLCGCCVQKEPHGHSWGTHTEWGPYKRALKRHFMEKESVNEKEEMRRWDSGTPHCSCARETGNIAQWLRNTGVRMGGNWKENDWKYSYIMNSLCIAKSPLYEMNSSEHSGVKRRVGLGSSVRVKSSLLCL